MEETLSAVSMSILVLKGRKSSFFQVLKNWRGKLEKRRGQSNKEKNCDGCLVLKKLFFFYRVDSESKRCRRRAVKTMTCLAFMLTFLMNIFSREVSLLPA